MESNRRKNFPEDIFAEENEKWSWPLGRTVQPLGTNISITNISNYDVHATEGKASSSSPSSDEDVLYKADSSTNSTKRSFRKHEFSSASEENGASSSPLSSRPHERVLPSIYDDDAQSGSPSGVFEKKDLAFESSFKKDFNSLGKKFFELNPLTSKVEKEKSSSSEKDVFKEIDIDVRSSSSLMSASPVTDVTKDTSGMRSSPSNKEDCRKSSSRDEKKVRSRSHSRDRKNRSPQSTRRSQDGYSDSKHSKRRSRSPRTRRSRSPKTRRSRSPKSKRSRSRDSRRHSRGRERRSRSRERRRSRSYERRHRSRRSSSRDRYRRRRYSRSRSRSHDRSRGSGNRKLGSLPLSTFGGAMTPQMALQQTMAAMSAKAQAMTGIALPKYYNPAAVNPLKYAEQVQKRKLLWQTKEKEDEQPKNSVWDKLTFDQDQDGKMTAKFRKLMGIKSEGGADSAETEVKESVLQKQAELFRDLDQQYEMARVTTHTQRGVGLGYSAASTLYPPVQK